MRKLDAAGRRPELWGFPVPGGRRHREGDAPVFVTIRGPEKSQARMTEFGPDDKRDRQTLARPVRQAQRQAVGNLLTVGG